MARRTTRVLHMEVLLFFYWALLGFRSFHFLLIYRLSVDNSGRLFGEWPT